MPLFNYRATDVAGKIVQGTLEAREERLVVQHLQQGGLIPIRIAREDAAPGRPPGLLSVRGRRIPPGDVVLFTRELAALLQAGLPLDRSLRALLEVTTRPALKTCLAQVLRDLQAGKSLSEALGRHPIFSPLYISMVQAGETGGFLETALARVGEYLQTVSELKSYVISALIYPAILAGVASISMILMFLFVVPRFEMFFKEMGQTLFFSTQVLIALSRGFRYYWWLGGLALGVAVVLVIRLSRTPQGRLWLDRLKLRAPFLGTLSRQVGAAFFAKTLGTLLNSGVPLVSALRVVGNSVSNRYLSKALSGVVAEMEKGQNLSTLLKKVGLLPELFLQMLAIGEETGHLADMLLSAADSLEASARAGVRRFLALLEPLLILGTALVVAFIIVSLLLPILNLYEIQF